MRSSIPTKRIAVAPMLAVCLYLELDLALAPRSVEGGRQSRSAGGNSGGAAATEPLFGTGAEDSHAASQVIPSYRKEYGVTVVLLGGVYWETLTGRYRNRDYGYTVRIPRGLTALCTPPPMPRHGFFIDIARELKAPAAGADENGGFVWANWAVGLSVDASWNSPDTPSLREAAGVWFPSPEARRSARLLTKSRTWLGGLRAIRYRARYRDFSSGEQYIIDSTVALRKGPSPDVLYEVTLRIPERQYHRAAPILNRVTASWRTIPIT